MKPVAEAARGAGVDSARASRATQAGCTCRPPRTRAAPVARPARPLPARGRPRYRRKWQASPAERIAALASLPSTTIRATSRSVRVDVPSDQRHRAGEHEHAREVQRLLAERLVPLRCIDAMDAHANLAVRPDQHVHGVAVDDADDFGGDLAVDEIHRTLSDERRGRETGGDEGEDYRPTPWRFHGIASYPTCRCVAAVANRLSRSHPTLRC